MISPEALATLAMLRRAARPAITGNRIKRPRGGRPNPCAQHREPAHPFVEIARIAGGRPNKRKQQVGGGRDIPAWQLVADAVERGDLPVGTPVRESQVCKVIKRTGFGGMEKLSLCLAENRLPIRIREAGGHNWIIALV